MQQDSGAKDEFIITKGFDYYRLIGYRCFGPLVIGFLDWMRQKAEQSKCEQIIFTARDCFVFNEAFKILYPNFNLPVKYLYLSRASTLPARIVEQPSVETFLNNATLKRYTSPNLLVTRYGFDEKQWHDRILSLGIEPDKPVDKNSYYVEGPYRKLAKMILETEKTGILENIKYSGMIEGDILEVTFFKHPGDEIRIFENSNDCVGQIIVQGNNMGECEKNAESVISKIEMTLKK